MRDPERSLNRHVRPFLRALTSLGDITATSGGRDVILAKSEPVAWIGVAHERERDAPRSKPSSPCAKDSPSIPAVDLAFGAVERKPSRTLEEMHGKSIADGEVVDAILRELGAMAGGVERFESPTIARFAREPRRARVHRHGGRVDWPPRRRARRREPHHRRRFAWPPRTRLAKLGRSLHALSDTSDEAVDRAISEAFDEDALFFGVRDRASIAKLVRATKTDARR